MAIPKPEPRDWLIANAQELQLSDREILELLRATKKRVDAILAELPKGKQEIRRAQLEQTRSRLLAEQAAVFQRMGDVVEARRAKAASRAARLSAAADAALLSLVGKGEQGQYLYDSALQVSQRAIDTALARMRLSQTPLARRIYNTSVWMGGRLGKLINETLASGINAREFAARARDWFDPNTPGGVRYAAMRLARTEINNAFHAMSVEKYASTPWVTEVDWNLSKSHAKPDECDAYAKASPFPKDKVPARPHPQCMCYVTANQLDEDEFIKNFLNGDYDDYLDAELEKNGWNEADPPAPPQEPTLTPAESQLREEPAPTAQARVEAERVKKTPSGKTPKPTESLTDFIPEIPAPKKLGEKIQNWIREGKTREEIRVLSKTTRDLSDRIVDRVLRDNNVPAHLMGRTTPDTNVSTPVTPPKAAEVRRTPVPPVVPPPPPPVRPIAPTPPPKPIVRAAPVRDDAPPPPVPQSTARPTGPKSEALKTAESRIFTSGMPEEMQKRVASVFAVQERVIGSRILRVKSVTAVAGKTLDAQGITSRDGKIRLAKEIVDRKGALKRGIHSNYFCNHDHDEVEGTIAHEMGHAFLISHNIRGAKQQKIIIDALEKAFGNEFPKKGKNRVTGEEFEGADFPALLNRWLHDNQNLVRRAVSEYATDNPNEFIAEVWTGYTMKDQPNRELRIVGDALRQIINMQKER